MKSVSPYVKVAIPYVFFSQILIVIRCKFTARGMCGLVQQCFSQLKYIEDKFLRITSSIICIYYFSFKRWLAGILPVPYFLIWDSATRPPTNISIYIICNGKLILPPLLSKFTLYQIV